MQKQYRFYVCQNCRKVVDKLYQHNYCRECLKKHFDSLRPIINSSHALSQSEREQTNKPDR